MNKEEFNRYCAGVMGHELHYPKTRGGIILCIKGSLDKYSPYDNLNQMVEVVENMLHYCTIKQDKYFMLLMQNRDLDHTIKQAFRQFIESTMDAEK